MRPTSARATSAVSGSATTTCGSRTSSRPSRCGRSRGSRARQRRPTPVYVAALTLDVLLGDVHSLKGKRAVVRPLVAELRRCYPGVAVAETGHLDLHRRAEIGVAVVSATAANAQSVLTECERLVAGHPEIELLSARQRLFNEED